MKHTDLIDIFDRIWLKGKQCQNPNDKYSLEKLQAERDIERAAIINYFTYDAGKCSFCGGVFNSEEHMLRNFGRTSDDEVDYFDVSIACLSKDIIRKKEYIKASVKPHKVETKDLLKYLKESHLK